MTKAARSMCGLTHPPRFLLKKVELIPRLRTWPLVFRFLIFLPPGLLLEHLPFFLLQRGLASFLLKLFPGSAPGSRPLSMLQIRRARISPPLVRSRRLPLWRLADRRSSVPSSDRRRTSRDKFSHGPPSSLRQ